MSDIDVPFYAQAALLEYFAGRPAPEADPDTLDVILDALEKRPDLRARFFRSRPHSSWADVFWERGFFKAPPEPQPTTDGYFFLPRWDVQEYLLGNLPAVGTTYANHLLSLGDHPNYRARGLEGLLALPASVSAKATPLVVAWLEDPKANRSIVDVASRLVTHLAAGGEGATALPIADALTAPVPSQHVREIQGYKFNDQAESILGVAWDARRILRGLIDALVESHPAGLIDILERHLLLALQLEEPESWETDTIWRSAIEDTGQDNDHHYKDHLLRALRHTVKTWVRQDPAAAAPLVRRYRESPIAIIRRLGLHVIRSFPDEFRQEVKAELHKPENYSDILVHHEFFVLLQDGFTHLEEPDRERVLELVCAGPSEDHVGALVESVKKGRDIDPEEYRIGYEKRWIRDRLWMIKDHLPAARSEALHSLVAEVGEPNHPGFLGWSSGVFAVSDVSPVTTEWLAAQSPQALIDYVTRWEPDPAHGFGPQRQSHQGLAPEVASIVAADVGKYKDFILPLAFFRAEYASALLGAFAALDSDERWESFLNLAEALLEIEAIRIDMVREGEVWWMSVRDRIARSFRDRFEKERDAVPDNVLQRIRDILLRLVDDPDPEAEEAVLPSDTTFLGSPETAALNHVRPVALSALILYGFLAADRRREAMEASERPETRPFEEEVRVALSRKLDRTGDPSLAVHSVYGRWLYWLLLYDPEWTLENLPRILPDGEDQQSLHTFVAAWDSYVLFSNPSMLAFRLLRPHYERAITNLRNGHITKSHMEPDRALASHVLAQYLHAEDSVESEGFRKSLLARWYGEALPEHHEVMASVLFQTCHDGGDKVEQYWPKAVDLWKWRSAAARESGYASEFRGEMERFAHLLEVAKDRESFAELESRLHDLAMYIETSGRRNLLWDELESYLATQAASEPASVITIYRAMYERASGANEIPGSWRQEGRTILEATAAAAVSRQEALSLVDFIARLGDDRYRDIYDKYST